MAAQGSSFDTPRACPFVALELDRDRRADTPDYRHRCFAEPTPAPRSIAHQEAYCLSPNFSACPVFQDWAVRAAARPVAGSGPAAATVSGSAMVGGGAFGGGAAVGGAAIAGAAVAAGAGAVGGNAADDAGAAPGSAGAAGGAASQGSDSAGGAADAAGPAGAATTAAGGGDAAGSAGAATTAAGAGSTWAASRAQDSSAAQPGMTELPEDASVTPAGAVIAASAAASTGIASPPTFATTWEEGAPSSEQLGVFDAAPSDPHSSYGEPDSGYPEPATSPAFVPPPSQPQHQPSPESQAAHDAAAAAVPAFLAGRATRPQGPPTAMSGSVPPTRPPTASQRDEIVPSWDIDGRYGAEAPHDQGTGGGGGSRLDGILTAIAVIAILALGVAAVLFLPNLLSPGKKPAATPGSSVIVATSVPSANPSLIASPIASVPASVTPTVAATAPASVGPVGSPRSYTIKPGDTLARVAKKFGLTVQDILDANPNINDPNNIFVGQIIVIPGTAASSAAP